MSRQLTRRAVMIGSVASATAPISSLRAEHVHSAVHVIQIRQFKFEPERIAVKVGDIILWANHDLVPHSAKADEYGWDTGEIVESDNRDMIVTAEMETTYHCAFHPHMKASILIEES